MGRTNDEGLSVTLGASRLDPRLSYGPPAGFQQDGPNRLARPVRYAVQSSTRFGFEVAGIDANLPLTVEMNLSSWHYLYSSTELRAKDAQGNTFLAQVVPDAPGKEAPFPNIRWAGCGLVMGGAITCSDVAVYKFAANGDLLFVSYLSGLASEAANFVGQASDGSIVVTGTTASHDFPVTPGTLQRTHAGPAPIQQSYSGEISGDFFAVKLDPVRGVPVASTYFGGPAADRIGETALGSDGSVYFLHKWLGATTPNMPHSSGALKPDCDSPCGNPYAARLSPALDRLMYGTYLPGWAHATSELHSDGSVYFTSRSGPGIATTPGAYQQQAIDENDAVLGRLDPTGTRLLFATYLGTPQTDWVLNMALAPDGTLWAHLSSFVQCCVDIDYRLVRLSADGTRLLADLPIDVGDLEIDAEGNLVAIGAGQFNATPRAFLSHSCTGYNLAYLKIGPAGEIRFATYLPFGTSYEFGPLSELGLPTLRIGDRLFDVVEGDMGVYAGCLANGASFSATDTTSPGAIMTLFGSKLGPANGVAFRTEDGRLPTVLGGTRVLVNGEPAPLLFVSHSQINLVLPYTLEERQRVTIQAEFEGEPGNALSGILVNKGSLSLFQRSPERLRPAAALNEDGTLNSPSNPAKPGSRIVLFGTGGGVTAPASIAGEITPLEIRRLANPVDVRIGNFPPLEVEYAGAAPGLVAGVTQINVKLPDSIPAIPYFPRGVFPLYASVRETYPYSSYVTISVAVD
jgi:uncharacterized protein (TIGR03437 family)